MRNKRRKEEGEKEVSEVKEMQNKVGEEKRGTIDGEGRDGSVRRGKVGRKTNYRDESTEENCMRGEEAEEVELIK